jgi:hypothetical protein
MTTSNRTASRKKTAPSVTASIADLSGQPPSSTEAPHEKDVGADCGPMSRQDVLDAQGHDMHPQKLVRLVGCHESEAEAERRAARDSE